VSYNLNRRNVSLRNEINVKTPFDAILKWYKLKSELFIDISDNLNNKIINLNKQIINLHHQSCEA
jgi:hypothetical protein